MLGLLHAEKALEDREPWAETLIQVYRLLLQDDARQFGVRTKSSQRSGLLRR